MGVPDWLEKLFKVVTHRNASLVYIANNKDSTISNVNFYITTLPTIIFPEKKSSLRDEFSSLSENNVLIRGAKEKEIYLVEKLQKFATITKKNDLEPIIRQKALFSAFSTLRSSNDTDDMSQLELEEKKIFMDLAKHGCIFKLILSLDIMKAFLYGFSKEEILIRIGDLCNTCDILSKYKNVQIVIYPDANNYDPIWTIDDILYHKQLKFEEKNNYNDSYWNSDVNEINRFNSEFDLDFFKFKKEMEIRFDALSISSLSEYIYRYTSDWISRHPIL